MKKISFLFAFMILFGSLYSMVRAGVDLGPDAYYYDYPDGYGYWYGPGYYYGVYYDGYPAYREWRSRYYYGGPYYWRYRHW